MEKKAMRPLLVVIDMQVGFRYPETEKIIPKIQKLSRKFGNETVWFRFQNKRWSLFEKQLHWRKMQTRPEQQIVLELRKSKGKIFDHHGYSVWTPAFRSFVKRNRFDEVIIAGIYTDVCVKLAAMEGFDLGMKVKIAKNACASPHGKKNHAYAVDSLKHILGKRNVISV